MTTDIINSISEKSIQETCINTTNIISNPTILDKRGVYTLELMKGTEKNLIVITNSFKYEAIFFSIDSMTPKVLDRVKRTFELLFPFEKIANDIIYFGLFNKYFNKAITPYQINR